MIQLPTLPQLNLILIIVIGSLILIRGFIIELKNLKHKSQPTINPNQLCHGCKFLEGIITPDFIKAECALNHWPSSRTIMLGQNIYKPNNCHDKQLRPHIKPIPK